MPNPYPTLRCSIAEVLTYLLRGRFLQNGCSKAEADGVRVAPYEFGGLHPVLAVVYCADAKGRERELLRVRDMAELNQLVDDAGLCLSLASSVRRIVETS